MPIYLNVDNCTGCGQCAVSCSKNAIIMIEKRPQFTPDLCVLCSHCYSICPEGCFSLLGYESENVTTDITKLVDCIAMRRTIRHFKQEVVP